MSNIEISKINIDETQLLIKDAQNRQDLASLSTEVQSISTDLTSLSTSISTNLNSLYTEVQSISTDLNSLSTSISTNYLPLSGGTLTGELTTSSHLTIKDDTLDTNSLEEMWPRHFSIKDKNDTTRGYFEIYQQPDGTQGFQIEAQRLINDNPIYNGIRLAITSTGERLIRVSPNAESAWRNALGASDGVWPIKFGGTSQSGIIKVVGTTTSEVTKGIINIYKWGKFVNIIADPVIYLATAVGAEGSAAIGTIPSGYRPKHAIRDVGGSYNNKGDILISTAGAISFTGNGTAKAAIHNIYFNITYVIN